MSHRALAFVELVTAVVYIAEWNQRPRDVISESLYHNRDFGLLLSFYVWLHLGLFAAANKRNTLAWASAAVASMGWMLVVAFDNRTGVVVHWVGVPIFCLASLACALSVPQSNAVLALLAVDAVLAASYMVLAVQRLNEAAPVQRAAFLLLMGLMAVVV